MRTVIIGASDLALSVAASANRLGHEIIIIDKDKDKLKRLAEEHDFGFLHGDGASPNMLRDARSKEPASLLALTDSDQINILAAVIGRSVGYDLVAPYLTNTAFQLICDELGLDHTISPVVMMRDQIINLLHTGHDADPAPKLGREANLVSIPVDNAPLSLETLNLPANSKPILILEKDDRYRFPKPEDRAEPGERIIILTNNAGTAELRKSQSGQK